MDNTDTQKPFGHIARIRVRHWYRGDVSATYAERTIHARGPISRIQTAARRVRGFSEILAIEPLTKNQWVRAYGHGAETGRNWIT